MFFIKVLFLALFSGHNLLENGGENLNTVTVCQARELAWRYRSISLKNCQEISPECLKIIATGKKIEKIELNKLKTLSIDNARILARFGGKIQLNGLESIPDNVLEVMSNCLNTVSLNGLKRLTANQAKIISKFHSLEMNGVETIEKEAYSALVELDGWDYTFGGIKKIEIDLLKNLVRANTIIILPGITKIDKEMAKNISSGKARIVLEELHSIDQECFSILSEGRGQCFIGLKVITKEQAYLYRNVRGDFMIFPTEDYASDLLIESMVMNMDGVLLPKTKLISERNAVSMGGPRIRDLIIPEVSRITPSQAYWLGMSYGNLDLRGVNKIDPICAEYLSRQVGELNLGGVKKLTPEIAEALGRHVGFLDLSGLEELDDICAEKLATHLGKIKLLSVKSISIRAIATLGKIKDPTIFNIWQFRSGFAKFKSIAWVILLNIDDQLYNKFHLSIARSIVEFENLKNPLLIKILMLIMPCHGRVQCL
jgi:hypothetical protein